MGGLSEKQKRILAFLNGRSDLSVHQIAQEVGLREHVVRSALDRLKAQEALSYSIVIDELKIGIKRFEVLLSISKSFTEYDALEQFLVQSPSVWYLTKLIGEYDYYLSMCLKKRQDLDSWFDTLNEKFDSLICKSSVSNYHGWVYLGSRHLAPQNMNRSTIRSGFSTRKVKLDNIDTKLISSLSRNALASIKHLSDEMGVAPSTVYFRRSRLCNLGVLGVPIYRLTSHSSVLRYKIVIKLLCPSLKHHSILMNVLNNSLNATEVVFANGEWDFAVRLEVEEPKGINIFLSHLKNALGNNLSMVFILLEQDDLKC